MFRGKRKMFSPVDKKFLLEKKSALKRFYEDYIWRHVQHYIEPNSFVAGGFLAEFLTSTDEKTSEPFELYVSYGGPIPELNTTRYPLEVKRENHRHHNYKPVFVHEYAVYFPVQDKLYISPYQFDLMCEKILVLNSKAADMTPDGLNKLIHYLSKGWSLDFNQLKSQEFGPLATKTRD